MRVFSKAKAYILDSLHNLLTNFQRCIPAFENAAFQVQIESTNTCGEEEDEQTFCVQTGYSNRKSCDRCRLVNSFFCKLPYNWNANHRFDAYVVPAIIVHHSWPICTIRAIQLGGNRKRCSKASIRARLI